MAASRRRRRSHSVTVGSDAYVAGRVWGAVRNRYRNLSTEDVWGPVGPVHAVPDGGTVAACGQEDVTPTGDPWPPSGAVVRSPECLRCRRLVPGRTSPPDGD